MADIVRANDTEDEREKGVSYVLGTVIEEKAKWVSYVKATQIKEFDGVVFETKEDAEAFCEFINSMVELASESYDRGARDVLDKFNTIKIPEVAPELKN